MWMVQLLVGDAKDEILEKNDSRICSAEKNDRLDTLANLLPSRLDLIARSSPKPNSSSGFSRTSKSKWPYLQKSFAKSALVRRSGPARW